MNTNEKIGVGGIGVALLTILTTVQMQIVAIECSEKSKIITEIVELAIETKSFAKYKMNIPNVCIQYTGKAEVSFKLKNPTRETIAEANLAFQEINEKFSLLVGKTNLYYSSLHKHSPFIPRSLQEIGPHNISGATIKHFVYFESFSKNLTKFTEQCEEGPIYHSLWDSLDEDIVNLTKEFTEISRNCTNNMIWGNLFDLFIKGVIILIFYGAVASLGLWLFLEKKVVAKKIIQIWQILQNEHECGCCRED